uniref:Embigin n=1 Tax=Bubo bubo TaxID=30461 RepID=A0A8C0EZ14_BUBBB
MFQFFFQPAFVFLMFIPNCSIITPESKFLAFYKYISKYVLSYCNTVIKTCSSHLMIFSYFFLVPKIEGKEKPIVSYEGDTAVMICKSFGYTPIAWTWYMTNGSEQVRFPSVGQYVIHRISANVTHMKILKLTKEDNGVYWCEAAFELGKSKGKLKLKVLSFMVPLKPFLAIVAEVVILVTIIFLYEMYSKKKEKSAEAEKEFDQIEQL